MPAVTKVFEMISTARVSKSAADAKEMAILRANDGITMNRYRLLADAKAKALAMAAASYEPPRPPVFTLPGHSGQAALQMAIDGFAQLGKATPHDVVVAQGVARVLTGGDADIIDTVTEADVLALERAEFLKLARHADSIARIEHMLETGKPLRN